MLTKEIFIIFLVGEIIAVFGGICPSPEVIYPCTCDTRAVVCGGSEAINLKRTFREMFLASQAINSSDKHFDTFELANTVIEQIEDNTFYDITFRKILLNNTKSLKRISAHAFQLYNMLRVEEFIQIGDTLLGNGKQNTIELFAALSSLVNVQQIELENHMIESIPQNAFEPINAMQNKLTVINLYKRTNASLVIEDYAFYYLNNLTFFAAFPKQLDVIQEHAFDFWKPSDQYLTIDLSFLQITDSAIEVGSFQNSKRPLLIKLTHNKFTTIDERVFKSILNADKRNQLDFYGNPLECDCRMAWIQKERNALMNQFVDGIDCKSGDKYFSLSSNYFDSCAS